MFCVDRFANYVVQTLINVVDLAQLRSLYAKLEPHFNNMETYNAGRNVINKLNERIATPDNEFLDQVDIVLARYLQQLQMADQF